ncbi:MAG: hypothetical protein ACKPE6_03565 [Gammaproteobacteria bacterium]
MRKKLLACLIAAAASLGTALSLADESTGAAVDAAVTTDVEATVEVVATTEESSAASDESTGGDVPAVDGSTPEVVVDPAPVSEELPTLDVVDGGSGSEHVDPVIEEEPVAVEGPVDEETVVSEEKPPVDEETVVDKDVVSEEEPVALEGGEVPVEGGATAELYTTTSSGDTEGEAVMYQTRGPEGCMECRTLTGTPENLGPEAPAPEVTADVIDDNAMAPTRTKRNAASN